MKLRTLILQCAMVMQAALPLESAAQNPRYKLVDIPTLGGPGSVAQVDGWGLSQFVNNSGVVVGGAATAIPDPTAPGCDDCFLIHAFRWQDGVVASPSFTRSSSPSSWTQAEGIC